MGWNWQRQPMNEGIEHAERKRIRRRTDPNGHQKGAIGNVKL